MVIVNNVFLVFGKSYFNSLTKCLPSVVMITEKHAYFCGKIIEKREINLNAHSGSCQLMNKTTCFYSQKNRLSCNDNLKFVGSIGQNILNNESHQRLSSYGACRPLNWTFKRDFSTERQREPLPRLMDFPQIAWPSVFKAIKNWILSNFIVTPYFDREFRIQDFLDGSKQAIEFVSQCLAQGDYERLEDVVSPEALREIKSNISRFSVQQRADLAVCKDDIFFSFPYQVGVMFDETEKEEQIQKRFVEITVCYHVLKGLQELQAQVGKMPINAGANAEFQEKVFILNYRFIKEFTKGKTGEWTVNIVNHYRPSDYV